MVKKSRKNANNLKQCIVIEGYHSLKGNGFIKEYYNEEQQKFSLAFLHAIWFQKDNGRILGYDTKHAHDGIKFGECHRHLFGVKSSFLPNNYDEVNEIFNRQYPTLIDHYQKYVTFDNYKINE